MEPDDDIRAAIRRYADGDIPPPDMLELRRRTRQRAQRQRWERGLAAAVIAGIMIGVAALVVSIWADPSLDEPIGPVPSPSASPAPTDTRTPSLTPTATSTPTASATAPSSASPSATDPGLPFPVSPGSGVNPGPVGGPGDVIKGLRLDAVDITAATCPNGEQCPSKFALTLTNTTSVTGSWEVIVYIYYDSGATLGNSAMVTADPGQEVTAEVTIEISRDSSQGRNGTYSWNWSAVRAN